MNRLNRLALAVGLSLASFFAFVASASADTVHMTFNYAVNSDAGVGTYPYNFTIGDNPVLLLCDSFSNHIVAGESWDATVHNIFTGPRQFDGLPNADNLYREAAYIFLEINDDPDVSFTNDANFGLWGLFDPAAMASPGYDANAAAIAADAALKAPGEPNGYYTHVVLYTPVPNTQIPPDEGTPQEFFGFSPQPQVPEPGSLLLLGTGLFGAAGVFRKRRS